MALCFLDWETRSELDLTIVGGARYAKHPSTLPLLLSWAIDDGPVKLWVPDLSDQLPPPVWAFIQNYVDNWGAFPVELWDFARHPGNYFVAWNMAFDRQIANHCATPRYGFPDMPINKTLDAMAQASASNLPGRLDMAGRVLGLGGKTDGGKGVMKKFADASLPMSKSTDDWQVFLSYSKQDTALMRDIWKVTRPLDASEWVEYWVSEKVNDRGMLADLDVCRGALKYREEDETYNRDEIKRLSKGEIPSVTMTARINGWVYPRLPHALQEFMVKERDDKGNPTKYSLSKDVIGRLLEEINVSDAPPDDEVVEVLELLQFGRASSAVKFEKILNQADGGRLKGSYVFNGAGQTGRFSSRGVQVHNLPRKSMNTKQNKTLELDLLDMIAAQRPIEELRQYGPVSSTLSKLIRPTFHAPEGRVLVWGDWSAIEARVAPWLANTHNARTAVLEPFETGADLYILNAEAIFGIPADIIQERYDNGDKEANEMRQSGKVAVLALGFLGGVGALRAMARGYGMKLSNDEAKKIVDGWRDRNRWARAFGDVCEGAAFSAIDRPEQEFKAGLLTYIFIPGMMRGTLLCRLPDGRYIAYPMARMEEVEKFGRPTKAITYLNGQSRRSLWNGLQIENCLAGDTPVVTRNGVKRLNTVQRTDEVWDGDHWVAHKGLIDKGRQPVIDLWGVRMTPDHKVLTNAGWKEAKDCQGFNREDVRIPDDVAGVGSRRGARQARTETDEPAALVYDLLDCGPLHRFTVLDETGRPFLVHNCTQATAASMLRQTLVKLETTSNSADIVGHTHDEVICETDEDNAALFAERLKAIMIEGFDWTQGLPLGAEVKSSWYYHK